MKIIFIVPADEGAPLYGIMPTPKKVYTLDLETESLYLEIEGTHGGEEEEGAVPVDYEKGKLCETIFPDAEFGYVPDEVLIISQGNVKPFVSAFVHLTATIAEKLTSKEAIGMLSAFQEKRSLLAELRIDVALFKNSKDVFDALEKLQFTK